MDAEMVPALATETTKRPQVSKYYYKKRTSGHSRNGKDDPDHSCQTHVRSPLGRHPLPSPAIPTYHTGGFYEIEHDKLPPKSPIHLKSIRVVKVCECTSLDVTVSFPSLLALRSFFSSFPGPSAGPELDERFVMSSNHAARILRRRVADEELAGEMHQDSFWLVTPRLYDFTSQQQPPRSVPLPPQPAPPPVAPATSSCLLTLQCKGWGVRRRVKYIGRHRDARPAMDGYETEASVKEEKKRAVQEHNSKKRKLEAAESSKHKHKDERDTKMKIHGRGIKSTKNTKPRHRKEKKRGVEADEGDPRRGKDRWSAERYAAAEASLLDIMRACGACVGAPVLRQALREEARKHIGDTGLLDHLLKHMAGRVPEGSTERFRRRHNADGAMEYWLEPAELAAVRREAGVSDPYWVPPPGWKPGDDVSPIACDLQVKRRVEELTDEVIGLKRHMEQLSSNLVQVGKEAKSEAQKAYSCWKEKCQSMVQANDKLEKQVLSLKDMYESVVQTNCKLKEEVLSLKEKYGCVVEKNGKLEERVAAFSSSFLSLKEQFLLPKNGDKDKMEVDVVAVAAKGPGLPEATNGSKQEVGAGKPLDNAADATALNGGSSSSSVQGGGKRMARKSSFRICKPQGTFVWPNMASGMAISGGGSSSCPIVGPGLPPSARAPAEVVFANGEAMANFASLDEHMMLGGLSTPPSASSTNASSAKLLLLPSPTSPIQPQPLLTTSVGTVPTVQPYPSLALRHMVDGSSSSSAPCGASLLEGKKGMFDAEAGGSNVGTELALATPSYC